MGLSPGLDFESRIFFKPDAARLLEQELLAPRYRCKRIHIGGNTDPSQPVERETRSTRSVLEVLQRFNHPFSIITKSVLIARDVDIFTWSDTPIAVEVAMDNPTEFATGDVVGQITWTAGPHSESADLIVTESIDPPTDWWRLTHPTELVAG